MVKQASLVAVLLLCGATVAFGQATTTPGAARLPSSGDWSTDVGASRLALTPEQKNQLMPAFEASAKEIKEAKDAFAEKLNAANEKLKTIVDTARKNGTLDDLSGNQDYQAQQAKITKMQDEETKAAVARRERLIDSLMKVLTSEQKRSFLRHSGIPSGDPKYMLQSRAMMVIDHWAPGINLPDDKFDPLVTKLAAMIKRHEADSAATGETDRSQLNQWWNAFDKKMKAAIEESLTEEQKTQAAANRLDRFQKFVATATERAAKSVDALDPTSEQKTKAAELVTAAREKMLALNPDAQEAWYQVYGKLREDIDKLLTDEQRARRDNPQPTPNP